MDRSFLLQTFVWKGCNFEFFSSSSSSFKRILVWPTKGLVVRIKSNPDRWILLTWPGVLWSNCCVVGHSLLAHFHPSPPLWLSPRTVNRKSQVEAEDLQGMREKNLGRVYPLRKREPGKPRPRIIPFVHPRDTDMPR